MVRMPSSGRVTPWAMHRATVEADKECRFTQMKSFSLPRVEAFIYGITFLHQLSGE
jgi:hypothetical protein